MADQTKIEWTDARARWHTITAAKRIGVTASEYISQRASGQKWCIRCREWHALSEFGRDVTRGDGFSAKCLSSIRVKVKVKRVYPTGPRGHYAPDRDGDKAQARHRTNHAVKNGQLPRPNDLPCTDCGLIWSPGMKRHEYDHYLGYAAEHHLHVQAVCAKCHRRRDDPKVTSKTCSKGHEWTPENTYHCPSGGRTCRECAKTHERARPPRGSAYWAKVNAKRRGKTKAGRLLDGRTHDEMPAGRGGV